jgi:DNA-binding NtrC family response regulator
MSSTLRDPPPGRPAYADANTEPTDPETPPTPFVRQFRLTGVEGPLAGKTWTSSSERCAVGSHASSDLMIEDPTVSRFHCEISVDDHGPRVRDLGSRNGTTVDDVEMVEGYLRNGSLLRLGHSVLRFEWGAIENPILVAEGTSFGGMVGTSLAIRATFALMERAAASEATVLIEGETGTGKELVAEAIHEHSARASRPMVIVDCSAISASLIESELFGHERGAFTGADQQRVGAAEEAQGSTLFLDEIGELPLELQPKLLRLIEQRTVRRLGGTSPIPVDVRVIAATNRDLRTEVNLGRFRPDLYFRLAVLRIPVPPLRRRVDDLPVLVDRLLQRLSAEDVDFLRTPKFLASLRRSTWPGNVRELQNYLTRCIVQEAPAPFVESSLDRSTDHVDASVPYEQARRASLARFERSYAGALLERHGGRVSEAAKAAGMDRVYLHKLMRRHGVGRPRTV